MNEVTRIIFMKDNRAMHSSLIDFIPDAMYIESHVNSKVVTKRYDIGKGPLEKHKNEVLVFLKKKYPEEFL